VLLHLLLEFEADAQLVLLDLHLNGIFLLLELFNVVHNNLGPIITVFRGRSNIGSRAKDLVSNILNGGRARPF
jgi:hypothetical protein